MELKHKGHELFQDSILREIEQEILREYSGGNSNYGLILGLLKVRKRLIDRAVQERQELFYEDMELCNRALYLAVRRSYDKAQEVWGKMPLLQEEYHVFLRTTTGAYPEKHPLQGEEHEELWYCATGDSYMNPRLDAYGIVDKGIKVSKEDRKTFEELITPNPELDYAFYRDFGRERTESLGLNAVFLSLYEHSTLAITDFLYVRDFHMRVDIKLNNEADESLKRQYAKHRLDEKYLYLQNKLSN